MEPTTKVINETVVNNLTSGDHSLVKKAQDAINDYTRMRMREDGFWRKILPPVKITNEELDPQVDTDKPVKVCEKEPNSPGAVSIPFASLPLNRYIRGPRYRVMFDRIVTPKFTKDVDELRTYTMDIRQVLSDNSIKDMLAEEDSKSIATINTILEGPDVTVPEVGVPLWRTISGGITRDTVAESMKNLPKSPAHLNPATILVNNVTIWDFVKWGRDEFGGDISEEIALNGWAERTFMNAKWIITIKRDLVPDNTFFQFAEPKFLGKNYLLEDTTMYVEKKAYMLEFFCYESCGSAIANVAGVGRIDFTP